MRPCDEFITVSPAYARDYKKKADVIKAWDENKDFLVQNIDHPDCGRYINKQDAQPGMTINIRYDQMRKICVINVK